MVFEQGKLIKPLHKTLRFVFVPKSVNPWYDVVREGAEKAAAEYKQLGIKIEIIWDAPPTAEIDTHNRKIETHIRTHPDGLAIACIASTTNTRSINNAVKAGLNVITFDTDAPESLRKIYIGNADDYQDGYDLANFLAEKIEYRGKVGILSGTLTAPNHVKRVNGFKAGIAQHKTIDIVFASPDSDDLQQAMNLTTMALKNYPDIKGFFCCDATNPIGCARVIKAVGKAGQVHIVGMDTLPETIQFIHEGVIDGVKMQRQWETGYWAIVYLVAINQGHTVPKEHPIESMLITKQDI
jgi:ribose transport system substrate-binding protein